MSKSEQSRLARVGCVKLWQKGYEFYIGSVCVGFFGKTGYNIYVGCDVVVCFADNITEAKDLLLKKIIESFEITPLHNKKTRYVKRLPRGGVETEEN